MFLIVGQLAFILSVWFFQDSPAMHLVLIVKCASIFILLSALVDPGQSSLFPGSIFISSFKVVIDATLFALSFELIVPEPSPVVQMI